MNYSLGIILSTVLTTWPLMPAPIARAQNPKEQIPASQNLMPHFKQVQSRKMLYVDGLPYTALAVEIPWMDLTYPNYTETSHVYDYLYPAAEAMGLNALRCRSSGRWLSRSRVSTTSGMSITLKAWLKSTICASS